LVDWLQTIVNIINDLKSNIYKVTDIKFSPVNDCTTSIINFIRSAKTNLFICVFTISDNEISKEILAKHQEGIDIKIITDNEKQFDKGSDIQELFDAGIQVKVDNSRHHMHHKFAIADQKQLLTGSYNWTRSASLYNQENLLILNDAFAIKRYLDEFYRLWKTSVSV
jgi:cardiolipin hydrolase